MKKKIVLVIIFSIILYVPSILKIINMNHSVNAMNKVKDIINNTDLSNIKIEGYSLGDKVYELDFSDKYADNKFLDTEKFVCDRTNRGEISYLGDFYIENCEITKLEIDLTVYDVQINNRTVKSVDEVIQILGNNYSTDIEKLSFYYDTYTFMDHKNNVEMHVSDIYQDKSKPYIVLKSIDRNYFDKHISFELLSNNNSFGVFWAFFLLITYPLSLISSDTYISTLTLIYMPLIYFIIFMPSVLAIVFNRHRTANIVLQILILFIIFIVGPFVVISAQ